MMSSQALLHCPLELMFRNESTAACVSNASASEKLVGPKGDYAGYYRAVGIECYRDDMPGIMCAGVNPGCVPTDNDSYENRVLQLFATRECANAMSTTNNSIHVAEQMYLPMYQACRLHSSPAREEVIVLECYDAAG